MARELPGANGKIDLEKKLGIEVTQGRIDSLMSQDLDNS